MRAALLLLRKDLRLRLRDRSVFLFGIVVPLGLTLLFSGIFPDPEELSLTAAVVDEDGSEVSRGFVEGLLPALVEDGVVERVAVADRAAAVEGVEDGELDAVWVFPAGFGDAVQQGRAAEVEVVVNADRPTRAEIARGIAESYAAQLHTVTLAVATTAVAGEGTVGDAELAAAIELAQAAPPAVVVGDLVAADRQLDGVSYLAAGMAAFFVFFTVQYGVIGLLEERKQGTLPRLLAAPIASWSVEVGKLIGAATLGLLSMTVLAVASRLLLGADWGPAGGVALLVVSLVVAAVGLMAFVGSFARTAEQAGNAQAIVAVVLGLAGGVFFPIPGDSLPLRVAAAASPHGWFIRGLGDATAAGSWTGAIPAALAIVTFGLVAAIPATLLLRRRTRW
jgi:ABC-2 type transport system permease protein